MKANYDIRAIQELMGHEDVWTTMIRPHVLNITGMTVNGPLGDTLSEAAMPRQFAPGEDGGMNIGIYVSSYVYLELIHK